MLMLMLLLVAVIPEVFCPYDPYAQDLTQSLQGPSWEHLLGTDIYGRDLLSRILVGARVSILSALGLVAIITTVGTLLGVFAGYFGGWFDTLVMRISDICFAFPGLVLAMAIAAILGGGMKGAVLSLALVSWTKYARLARSQTLSIKDQPFIQAAILSGDHVLQVVWRHIVPNVSGLIITTGVLDIGTMLKELAAFSFLGLGAQAPTAEWGRMMNSGRSMLLSCPWVILAPGFAIFITVITVHLFGDALRDYLDRRTYT